MLTKEPLSRWRDPRRGSSQLPGVGADLKVSPEIQRQILGEKGQLVAESHGRLLEPT